MSKLKNTIKNCNYIRHKDKYLIYSELIYKYFQTGCFWKKKQGNKLNKKSFADVKLNSQSTKVIIQNMKFVSPTEENMFFPLRLMVTVDGANKQVKDSLSSESFRG